MSNDNTYLKLESALQRILQGNTKRIPEQRKLSIRAVEEEANLGNGSCYYYPGMVKKIKELKSQQQEKKSGEKPISMLEKLRCSRKDERRIKQKYRTKVDDLKREREQMAAVHHQLSFALRQAHVQISELE